MIDFNLSNGLCGFELYILESDAKLNHLKKIAHCYNTFEDFIRDNQKEIAQLNNADFNALIKYCTR